VLAVVAALLAHRDRRRALRSASPVGSTS